MLDFSKLESKEILKKLGFPEQLIEKLTERQKNGEKLRSLIGFTNVDGKKIFMRIPDSPEEIDERKRNSEEKRKIKKEYKKKWYREHTLMTEEERINVRRKRAYERTLKNFWEKVDKKGEDECWEWLGAVCSDGYGSFLYNGKVEGAHRVSCIIHNIEISDGTEVTHSCDNRSCVNPNHLKPKTHKDNMQEMFDRNRANKARGENNGMAKLTWDIVKDVRKEYTNDRSSTITSLSKKFNIPRGTIGFIVSNKSWVDKDYIVPTNRNRVVSENIHFAKSSWKEVNEIRGKYKHGESIPSLAKYYDMPYNTIKDIVINRTWKDVNYQKWIDKIY